MHAPALHSSRFLSDTRFHQRFGSAFRAFLRFCFQLDQRFSLAWSSFRWFATALLHLSSSDSFSLLLLIIYSSLDLSPPSAAQENFFPTPLKGSGCLASDKESQYRLGRLVRLREHRRSRLLQDVEPCQVRAFRCHIQIRYPAIRRL